jgi:hypothetical protein
MKTQPLTPKMLRQRKFLLVAPLLILPFLTLFFWALGGGKVNATDATNNAAKGFNMNLPGAKLKNNSTFNKMSYYNQAALDSVKLKQEMKSDPYYRPSADSAGRIGASASGTLPGFTARKIDGSAINSGQNDPAANEDKIYERLAQLQATMNKPVTGTAPAYNYGNNTPAPNRPPAVTQQSAEDPEMKQMNGMLEKILDIEHPDRLQEHAKDKDSISHSKRFRAIPAVIDGNQKVTQGTVVRIKLLDTVTLNGQLIPKGQLLYGSGSLYNQRIGLNIRIIHIGYEIIPVDLTVFDMVDGLEGICVPEALTGDAVKEGADNGVENMELMSMDESMGAQAATAGINAAKGLFSKKIKRVKGKLKGGHLLLLRDNLALKSRSKN